ncbi:MAG: zinc ABC transporter substrate-binding protein [Clostridiales bacterium]|nr:zinc ABC transporter substrate-binding protein [Clostridiales bacterium]
MKKRLHFIKLCVLTLLIVFMTSCVKVKINEFENSNIITTSYPLVFFTNSLYGDHAKVKSIYPNETNPNNLKFNDKQLDNFASNNLYIYLGQDSEQSKIAIELKNKNPNILLIDAGVGINTNSRQELLLNPSNILMMAKNIKKGLEEYINNTYISKNIEKNLNDLNVKISEIDAELRLTYTNSKYKTLVVTSNSLKFLEKYGFEVVSLDKLTRTNEDINYFKQLVKKGLVNYIYSLENIEDDDVITNLIRTTGVKKLTIRSLDTITDEEEKLNKNYYQIMNENIDLIKKETYK